MKRIRPQIVAMNELEPKMQALGDEALRGKTVEFRERLERGAKLDDLLIEAFAVAREAGRRALEMRHFDVQMVGGVVLHEGRIAEMKTGEGKTLVATLALYLNALEGKGAHLVTVNDYLASRDAEWMGRLYRFLGLTVGTVVHGQSNLEKKRAYRCDITYGQNNEFGFDYLRDNMKYSIYDYVQRELHYAIVDEVDSILVDEARTPLIISGAATDSTDLYRTVNGIVPFLKRDIHYVVDEKAHNVTLTDEGVEVVERKLAIDNLFDPVNIDFLHHVNTALKAHTLYKRDVNYMVTEEGEVVIIDEFTGRLMPGRRWSDGLHQAVEAKENVSVRAENRTLATISFQNYFRLYDKLAGMTGTADTEAEEFNKIYKLDVVVVPTNKPLVRNDAQDVVFKTEREKFTAVVEEILECHERGQPVLVGTTSVEKSEAISRILKKKGVEHSVLNAKQHQQEAFVVAQAGRKGSVTIATNMAGRGTDIVLGGNPDMIARQKADPETQPEEFKKFLEEYRRIGQEERRHVISMGGLHILGTERHESRRIDNQLRGRSGRQGDPGTARFYLSLEDDLLRIFGAERMSGWLDRLGMEEGVPIEHRYLTKAIENAQKKVEARNFDIRKNLIEYDDVMNQQRKTVYALRRQVLEGTYHPVAISESDDAEAAAADFEVKLDERLAGWVKPILEALVRAYGRGAAPDAAPLAEEEIEKGAGPLPVDRIKWLDVARLEQEVYYHFGCRVPLEAFSLDAPGALARLVEDVPRSLSAQRERLLDVSDQIVMALVDDACPEKGSDEEWDLAGLAQMVNEHFNLRPSLTGDELRAQGARAAIEKAIYDRVLQTLEAKERELSPGLFLRVFRLFFIEEIDKQWIDHLENMDHLRHGIGLRGYGHRDPKQEYKKEGYAMFVATMGATQTNVLKKLFRVQVQRKEDVDKMVPRARRKVVEGRGGEARQTGAAQQARGANLRTGPKVGRNDPCPCGSGKKYKKCCMAKEEGAQVG
ncbi:MAG: preprotein translocase subunit SecA [Deltaproteobacteria bacterium]|nr:preprotein translocase subunit SecA [Deltaproteobacteria bacterium]